MNEITRIHLAKTPYDIEVDAKKDLEAYLKTLESYSQDADIVTDVEIRMTEILASRGVQKNGVIGADDVSALKEQLGDPQEFLPDGETPAEPEMTAGESGKKLFRDTDNAVLGGVLSGVAAFFKVNPLWTRLLFVILLFASFGTMILVYVVLWLAVPAAKTAADKLQMAGRPVTVNSIREQSETDATRPEKSNSNIKKVLLTLLGIGFVLAALAAAGVVVAATVGVTIGGFWDKFAHTAGAEFLQSAFVLGMVSGVLFIALMVLAAYASFARKLSRRVAITGGIIIVLGLAAFGVGAGLAQYGATAHSDYVHENTRTEKLQLPADMAEVTAVKIDSPDLKVSYGVTTLEPYAYLRAVAKNRADMPSVTFDKQGKTLTVHVANVKNPCEHGIWCGGQEPTLEIHGPALQTLAVADGTSAEYAGFSQPKLTLTAGDKASVHLAPGYVGALDITASRDTRIALEDTTVGDLNATLKNSVWLNAGTVQNLTVQSPSSCPAHERSTVQIQHVNADKITVNGSKKPAGMIDSSCLSVMVTGDWMAR